jgi:hypothetical protein
VSEEGRTGWEDADRWFSDEAPRGGEGGGGGGRAGDGGEPEGPPPVPRCEVCGAELEPDQTYCLECGSPTPLAPRLRRGGRTAAILAGSMVVLGLGAGALAYAVMDDDEPGAVPATATVSTATAGTLPVVPLPPGTAPTTGGLPPDTSFTTPTTPPPATGTGTGTGFDTVTGGATPPPATGTEPAEPPATTDDLDPDPDTGSSDWPPGRTAWTAVLSSVRSESDARAAKSRVIGGGDDAGVLFSSDHPELRSGFWVVFSGVYPDRGPAIAQATRMRPEFPGAYARRISG